MLWYFCFTPVGIFMDALVVFLESCTALTKAMLFFRIVARGVFVVISGAVLSKLRY